MVLVASSLAVGTRSGSPGLVDLQVSTNELRRLVLRPLPRRVATLAAAGQAVLPAAPPRISSTPSFPSSLARQDTPDSPTSSESSCSRRGFLGGGVMAATALAAAQSAPPSAAAEKTIVAPLAPAANLPPWAAAVSGALQGIAQNVVKQLILHPLDTVKTRLQVEGNGGEASRAELFRDVYRGLLPCLVSGTPGSAAFFSAKEAVSAALREQHLPAQLTTLGGVVSGVLVAKAVRTPFDVAETKAMATVTGDKPADNGFEWDGSFNAVKEVLDREGLAGLYRGYGANVAYKLPADASKFLAYEALRGTGVAGSMPPGVAGAAATLISNIVTTPLDVVRTRIMVNEDASSPTAQKGVLGMLSGLVSQGDPKQLFAGLDWRIARGILAGAIQFTVLEGTKEAVEKGR